MLQKKNAQLSYIGYIELMLLHKESENAEKWFNINKLKSRMSNSEKFIKNIM